MPVLISLCWPRVLCAAQGTLVYGALDKYLLSCTGAVAVGGLIGSLHLVSQDQIKPIRHIMAGEGKRLKELWPKPSIYLLMESGSWKKLSSSQLEILDFWF